MLICFYLAIFKLTSAKFLTYAYNLRTVKSNNMKFGSSLRLMSCMFVSNFEAISHVTLVLGPENRPESLSQKAVLFKNGLSVVKNISLGNMPQNIISSQPSRFRPQ